MPQAKRERFIENLAIASALGFLTLVMAGIDTVCDMQAKSSEIAVLTQDHNSKSSIVEAAERPDTLYSGSIYRVSDSTGTSYMALIALRSSWSAALFSAKFSRQGELSELKLLGSPSMRLPEDGVDAIKEFPDADASLHGVADSIRAAELGLEARS